MAFSLQKIILIALILSIAIPISIGYRGNSDDESDWGDDYEPESDDGDDSNPGSDVGGDNSEIGHYLRDLCSNTKKSKQCWKIIKPDIDRFTDTDIRSVTGVIIDMGIEKSDEIKETLNQLHHDSGDDVMKKKYKSCSKYYYAAKQDLKTVKGSLDSDDYQRIKDHIKDVTRELKRCKHQFEKKSNDLAHIKDKNKEFGHYVEIIKTVMKRFVKEKDKNGAKN